MTKNRKELENAQNSTTKVDRDAYIWNTASGLLLAFQSVIILMALMRVCDVVTAGVFTIAYANANLFQKIGMFGMRNYQASDIEYMYRYRTYMKSRIITTLLMVVVGFVYLAVSASAIGYDTNKVLVTIVMILFKSVDSIEDAFMGNCQQHGRLDVAAKPLTWRLGTTLVVFVVCIVLFGDLLVPLCVSTVYTTCFCIGEYRWMRSRFDLPAADLSGSENTKSLLRACLPLFLATFLMFFIGNAPKYAIDAYMGDAEQAYYGFIAMPVFVVNLLASFIYNPIVVSLSGNWLDGENVVFLKRLFMQALYIVGITIVCDLAALIAGVPVLNILYNADLALYLGDLLVLVTGGGFMALATLFTMGITIMRKQHMLTIGYFVASAIAAIGSPYAVQAAGIDGASWIYLISMAILALWFGVVLLWYGLRPEGRKR